MHIWYVMDWLSKQPIENKYFSKESEAKAFRQKLGYGIVKSFSVVR